MRSRSCSESAAGTAPRTPGLSGKTGALCSPATRLAILIGDTCRYNAGAQRWPSPRTATRMCTGAPPAASTHLWRVYNIVGYNIVGVHVQVRRRLHRHARRRPAARPCLGDDRLVSRGPGRSRPSTAPFHRCLLRVGVHPDHFEGPQLLRYKPGQYYRAPHPLGCGEGTGLAPLSKARLTGHILGQRKFI